MARITDLGDSVMRMEPRPFRPFKTSEEYLVAMVEDLAEWLNNLYNLRLDMECFFDRLEDGVALCKHANNVRQTAHKFRLRNPHKTRLFSSYDIPETEVKFREGAAPGTFFARDNIHNFISWCRALGIYECLLFETDDLVMRKNIKSVVLCLLEVARRGAKYGMEAPLLVQMEREIDRDIAKDRGESVSSGVSEDEADGEEEDNGHWGPNGDVEFGPHPQLITNDLKSLDELVRELVERCQCPTQFPMIRVAEGKYRIGDTKVMIYVRILRSHVMVRVGGGWNTLENYLDKHDPCRCKAGHRRAHSASLTMKSGPTGTSPPQMVANYERSIGGASPSNSISPSTKSAGRSPSHHAAPLSTPPVHRKQTAPAQLPATPLRGRSLGHDFDSSSEVSDEGYRSESTRKMRFRKLTPSPSPGDRGSRRSISPANVWKKAPLPTPLPSGSPILREDRPDSQLTHTSSDCSIPSDDGSSPAASTRRIAAKSAGSRIPVLSASNSRIPTPVGNTSSPRRSPERSGSRTRRRSIDNSALKPTTSEASANTSSFQRGVHGRYSYRNYNTPSSGTLGRRRPQTPRGSTTPAANRTNKSSGLAGCPNSQAGSTVSLSGERKGLGRPSTCPPKASSPLSERSNLPPLLREILNDKAALASDENVLAKMADLVAKYREVNNGCTASSRSSSQENVEVQGKPEFHEEEVKSVIEPEEVKQNCSPIVSETSLDANEEQPSQVEEILQQMSDLDAEFGEELKRLEEESKNVERQDSLELFESLEESLIKVPDQDVLCGDGNNNSLNQRPPETESPTRFQDMLLLPDDPPRSPKTAKRHLNSGSRIPILASFH